MAKVRAHGVAGMQNVIDKACQIEDGFQKAGPLPGSIESTFGRIHDAVSLPLPVDDYRDAILKLAQEMKEDPATAVDGPADAGIAFLGQFIDHDLTLDVTTDLGVAVGDVTNIQNFRTPRLDLDCVYGSGPEASPHLFDRSLGSGKMLFGRNPAEGHDAPNPQDLPRNRQGTALIGDPRNDENLFVSQLHGRQFVAKHNVWIDTRPDFEETYKDMVEDYHRRIVDTFLPAVVDGAVLQPFLDWLYGGTVPVNGSLNWSSVPDMPVEFSAAAYRFGHSMIRQTYSLNGSRIDVPIFNGGIEGFSPVEEENNLDFSLFFGPQAQKSRPIDTKLPQALLDLPASVVGQGGERNLAFRNMDRGQVTFKLPSGEQMATYMGFAPIPTDPRVAKVGLSDNTPLWFYILLEAENNGGKLGEVGGSLVAGVLVNLLRKGNSAIAA